MRMIYLKEALLHVLVLTRILIENQFWQVELPRQHQAVDVRALVQIAPDAKTCAE